MTTEEEAAYQAGARASNTRIMLAAARELGHDDPLRKAATLIAEREAAIVVLRRLCAEHGDNEWPDGLHLADIIEKRLGAYLFSDDEEEQGQ